MDDVDRRGSGVVELGEADMASPAAERAGGMSRRRFLGYVIAGSTLIAAAELGQEPAEAAIPTTQPVDLYDLTDLLTIRRSRRRT